MYVAIDIGGTKTLVAVFEEAGQLGQTVKFLTNDNYQQFLEDLKTQLGNLEVKEFAAGAVGVAGRLDRANDLLLGCGNLSWKNEPLRADLEKLVGCRFAVENDAQVGGLFEAINVINEYKDTLFITIGTGIGIAYIKDGLINLDTIDSDGGGHNMMMEHDGKIQPWEGFASGTAIVKKYGKKASEITDEATWKEIVHNISLGILELLGLVSPDVIIIGGGVGSHFDRFGHLLEAELKQYQTEMLNIPPLLPAQRPEEAVIYGCYQLIKQTNGQTA